MKGAGSRGRCSIFPGHRPTFHSSPAVAASDATSDWTQAGPAQARAGSPWGPFFSALAGSSPSSSAPQGHACLAPRSRCQLLTSEAFAHVHLRPAVVSVPDTSPLGSFWEVSGEAQPRGVRVRGLALASCSAGPSPSAWAHCLLPTGGGQVGFLLTVARFSSLGSALAGWAWALQHPGSVDRGT